MGSIHIIYILRLCFLEQFWSHSKSNNNVEHIFTCIFSSIYLLWGFPVGSVIKKFPSNTVEAGDVGLIPGSGRTPGGPNLENWINLFILCLDHSDAQGEKGMYSMSTPPVIVVADNNQSVQFSPSVVTDSL